jgi:uncharacterized membrane protein YdjX (TVP38/TMEM64 family)
MKVEISQKLKTYRIASLFTIFFGVVLLVYMIRVENEPGALPLLLILSGLILYIVTRVIIRQQMKQETAR